MTAIRHQRSTKSLGFGVQVRAVLTLPTAFEASWVSIEADVLAGNNSSSANVTFGGDAIAAEIEPM